MDGGISLELNAPGMELCVHSDYYYSSFLKPSKKKQRGIDCSPHSRYGLYRLVVTPSWRPGHREAAYMESQRPDWQRGPRFLAVHLSPSQTRCRQIWREVLNRCAVITDSWRRGAPQVFSFFFLRPPQKCYRNFGGEW